MIQSVKMFSTKLQAHFIRLLSDNMGVVHCINNNFSKVTAVRNKLMELHDTLLSVNATISAVHLPGQNNIVADTISRVDLGDYYQFNLQYIDVI